MLLFRVRLATATATAAAALKRAPCRFIRHSSKPPSSSSSHVSSPPTPKPSKAAKASLAATPMLETTMEPLFHESSIPSMVIAKEMDADLGLEPFQHLKGKIFLESTARYVAPKDFNYQLPTASVPEYAFIGRSNVGKSSLINALLAPAGSNGGKLVRVSKEPGCTQTVNYYSLTMKQANASPYLYLVDLPGYGFARQSQQQQHYWKKMIYDYLNCRDQSVLRRVFLLVDSRHGLKDSDIDMMAMLDSCFLPYQVVLTKQDVASTQDLYDSLQSIFFHVLKRRKLNSCMPVVPIVSTQSSEVFGVDSLMLSIAEMNSHVWAKSAHAQQSSTRKNLSDFFGATNEATTTTTNKKAI